MSSSPISVPNRVTVLVIGGGPGGSYAASVLAREGIDVCLIEAEKFPRYHIGESLLASFRHFLRYIDLEKKFDEQNFAKKRGAAFKLNQKKRDNYTDFVATDPGNFVWNVVRSESDHLLLQHVTHSGGLVIEETRVTDIEFEPIPGSLEGRPVSAKWTNKAGEKGSISFDYLIDASGRQGIMSTKYLKNRTFNPDFRNVAIWGYWSGCAEYMPGTSRGGAPYFEALTDSSGWAWLIPLNLRQDGLYGTASIGIVMKQDISNAKKKGDGGTKPLTVIEHYLQCLGQAPSLKRMLDEAELLRPEGDPIVRSASDYSYSASTYAGPNYRIVGDAGAFIDPYFSSGVHLAIAGGLSAAATICASIRGDCSESEAGSWHTARVDTAYTRFLVIVRSIYKEIRSQDDTCFASGQDENFDKAFEEICPVIQGHVDSKSKLSDAEIERITNFYTRHAYQPATTEERRKILANLENDPTYENKLSGEQKAIVNSIKVRKLFRLEDINHIDHFVTDNIRGRQLRLARGSLGLTAAN